MSTNNINQPTTWTPERVSSLSKTIAIVLLGGIALGLFATKANLYYVAAIVAAVALVFLVSWKFEAALMIYALVAFMPWGQTPDLAVGGSGVGKGVYVSEAMLGFLLIIWAGKYLFSTLPKKRIGSGFYLPIALYLAYSILNVVNAYIFWDPHVDRIYQKPIVNVIEIGIRFLSAGALVMFATTISNKKWLKRTTICVMIPGFYNLFNGFIGQKIPVAAPWWPCMALLPIGYCLAVALDSKISARNRVLGILVVVLAVFVILIKGMSWVSGWLGLMGTLGCIAFIKNKKVFFSAAVLGLIVICIAWPFIHKNVVVSSEDEGDFDRFSLMAASFKYATHFPLGVGFGNYRTYNSYHYGELWKTTTYTSAHGTYSQHLSEGGIPGFILFVSIILSGFYWVYKEYCSIEDNCYSKIFLLAVLGQIVGIAASAILGDYIIPTYHNGGLTTFSATVYSWIIWGLAIAHVRMRGIE